MHDPSCILYFRVDEAFLLLVVLNEHHRVEGILQVFAHHNFLDLRTALENEVEERLGTHAVVELILRGGVGLLEVVALSYRRQVSLAAKTHVDLVAHHLVQWQVSSASEQVCRSWIVTLNHSGGVLTELADEFGECHIPFSRSHRLSALKSLIDDLVAFCELLLRRSICLHHSCFTIAKL